jgi:hypothetical protein
VDDAEVLVPDGVRADLEGGFDRRGRALREAGMDVDLEAIRIVGRNRFAQLLKRPRSAV